MTAAAGLVVIGRGQGACSGRLGRREAVPRGASEWCVCIARLNGARGGARGVRAVRLLGRDAGRRHRNVLGRSGLTWRGPMITRLAPGQRRAGNASVMFGSRAGPPVATGWSA